MRSKDRSTPVPLGELPCGAEKHHPSPKSAFSVTSRKIRSSEGRANREFGVRAAARSLIPR